MKLTFVTIINIQYEEYKNGRRMNINTSVKHFFIQREIPFFTKQVLALKNIYSPSHSFSHKTKMVRKHLGILIAGSPTISLSSEIFLATKYSMQRLE